MQIAQQLQEKWKPVIDHPDLPPIEDAYKRAVTAVLLENQEKAIAEEGGSYGMLGEAVPANNMGISTNTGTQGSGIAFRDPILISMIRRAMPQLVAYDVCGVQPMTGPTGLIFAMRARYTSQGGTEALYSEADTAFGGTDSSPASVAAQSPSGLLIHTNGTANSTYGMTGTGQTTVLGETVGDSASNAIAQMAFSIEKVTVAARTRALKGEYTMELAQDLKAVHGLDAEAELSNILSSEILAEINREVIRTIGHIAQPGAQQGNVTSVGIFDLDTDSNGRWSVEKFKGLLFQIEREANQIAKDTRRGKGNMIITSSDVASALHMAGVLDYAPAMSSNLNVDEAATTFAGVLNGRYKVYVDPFALNTSPNYFIVGYRGSSQYDAGLFYCPYVPLQMVRAVGENNFQPKIGFKTRYGFAQNPFATSGKTGVPDQDNAVDPANQNYYYRIVRVANLM